MSGGQAAASAIDWASVRRRLARVDAQIGGAADVSGARARQILDDRARALARVPAPTPERGPLLDALRFRLGASRFAVATRFVREVGRLPRHVPVPGAPDFILGVGNLRGEILMLMDLGGLFGLGAVGLPGEGHMVVLGEGRPQFAVPVDAAEDVVTLALAELAPLPGAVPGIATELMTGVAADGAILLDAAALLASPRLTIRQA